MKKKFYLYTTIFVVFVLFLGAYTKHKGFWSGKSIEYSNMTRETYTPPAKIKVNLIIAYSDDNQVTYEEEADEGDSVFNLLRTVTAKQSIDLKVKEYDFGTLVESIGGVENTTEKSWIYFVNGKSGDVAADQKIFENGDTVSWKYIEPTF